MSRAPDLVLRGHRVVTPDGVRPAAVHVRDGVIVEVTRYDDVPPRMRVDEAGAAVVMPGLVDTHVHINEPGRDWEGFVSATRAAAAGGITTLVDMPLNSIPSTTTRDALLAKEESAADLIAVDVAFWGGVVPGNTDDLSALHLAGVLGFKCFLCPSGVDEFEHVTEDDLRQAMPELARLQAPLLVHAELPSRLAAAPLFPPEDEPKESRRYRNYLRTRPPEAEIDAVELLIRLSREYGTAVHIVHLSAAGALESLAAARTEGLPITIETCPHYLHFSSEEVRDGATTLKCAPPIREAENRERLWRALGDRSIDMVVSDHSPCPPELKERHSGNFARAWGGISSLQLGLSVVWTGARARGHSIEEVARWMSAAPAALAGLEARKGAIAIGCDADLVMWHPERYWHVDPSRLHHRHAVTPYAGATLHGVVEATYLRGMKIFEHGELLGPPAGIMITRDAA